MQVLKSQKDLQWFWWVAHLTQVFTKVLASNGCDGNLQQINNDNQSRMNVIITDTDWAQSQMLSQCIQMEIWKAL